MDKALSRLAQKGTIRRLARGLCDYPESHPVMGLLMPGPDAIAGALAGKAGIRLQPSGAYAANRLGLSTQVPARILYLTDGPSRRCGLETRRSGSSGQHRGAWRRRAGSAGW